MGHHPYGTLLAPKIVTFPFTIVAKWQIWSSNKIILWSGVTTWGTVLRSQSIWKVETYQFRAIKRPNLLTTLRLQEVLSHWASLLRQAPPTLRNFEPEGELQILFAVSVIQEETESRKPRLLLKANCCPDSCPGLHPEDKSHPHPTGTVCVCVTISFLCHLWNEVQQNKEQTWRHCVPGAL